VNPRIALSSIFGARKPLIGMVHLEPLPGAPLHAGGMDAVLEHALQDAEALAEAGADGIIIENFGDVPFHPERTEPVTIAAMAVCVAAIARAVALPIGVNVLRNDAAAALGIAVAAGASFLRVNVHSGAMLTDQGWLAGRAHETLRQRAALGAGVAICADVLVKHAVAPHGLTPGSAARDAWQRGRADALIVSGGSTGEAASLAQLREVRAAVPDATVWIGSGVTAANAAGMLAEADGAIIGSALQRGRRAGNRVDLHAARALFAAARG
jgi:uncharacterized protein